VDDRHAGEPLVDGRPPEGSSAPLTPLHPDQSKAVLARADRIIERLQEYLSDHAPQELEAFERPQAPMNTLVWAAELLERLQQIVQGLAPGQVYTEDLERKDTKELTDLYREIASLSAGARKMLPKSVE